MLNLGPLLLLALVVGEVVSLVKLSKHRKRIDKLEEEVCKGKGES